MKSMLELAMAAAMFGSEQMFSRESLIRQAQLA